MLRDGRLRQRAPHSAPCVFMVSWTSLYQAACHTELQPTVYCYLPLLVWVPQWSNDVLLIFVFPKSESSWFIQPFNKCFVNGDASDAHVSIFSLKMPPNYWYYRSVDFLKQSQILTNPVSILLNSKDVLLLTHYCLHSVTGNSCVSILQSSFTWL